jgi:predicted RNA binding protein YcfA (HicA-like mRNA interferase family)
MDALTQRGSTPRGESVASEMRFAELLRLVQKHGWFLLRVRGSHHVLQKPDGSTYSVPVHHGKVKPAYIREIKKQIGD